MLKLFKFANYLEKKYHSPMAKLDRILSESEDEDQDNESPMGRKILDIGGIEIDNTGGVIENLIDNLVSLSNNRERHGELIEELSEFNQIAKGEREVPGEYLDEEDYSTIIEDFLDRSEYASDANFAFLIFLKGTKLFHELSTRAQNIVNKRIRNFENKV